MITNVKSIRKKATGAGSTISYPIVSHQGIERLPRRICTGRFVLIGFLAVSAGVAGWAVFSFVSDAEQKRAETHFLDAADAALASAREITQSKRIHHSQLGTFYAHAFPAADQWPFVTLPGFEAAVTAAMGKATFGTSFSPIVYPNQIEDFVEFARQYYSANGWNSYLKEGKDRIGEFGVQSFSIVNGTIDYYRDTTAESVWGSPYKFVAPVFQLQGVANEAYAMVNSHSFPDLGSLMDILIAREHGHERIAEEEKAVVTGRNAVFSGPTFFANSGGSPGALIIEPIYPINNSSRIAGFVQTGLYWESVLQNAFGPDVSGVDCILDTSDASFTFGINEGAAQFRGKGDLHDPAYNMHIRSTTLVDDQNVNEVSAYYSLRIYPRSKFFESNTTNSASIATVGVVSAILFTSVLFILYDFWVRQAFDQKSAILDAKRQFMRFISHEVRTPLNSVCMGLKLMKEELEKMFRCDQRAHEEEEWYFASEILTLSDQIHQNAISAVDILSDLLNYDKIESGTLNLELTVIPIFSLLGRITEEFRLPAKSKRIKLKFDLRTAKLDGDEEYLGRTSNPQELTTEVLEHRVVGDTVRIAQVLRNLVSNAVKFTPDGGNVTVDVAMLPSQGLHHKKDKTEFQEFVLNDIPGKTTFARSGILQIKVIDTGVGLSEEQLELLFGQGVQFNAAQLQAGKGSGLGLYISKGIVNQHGGTLEASSAGLGLGTIFTVTLPLFHVPDAVLPERPKRMKSDQREIGHVETNGLCVLIVDDASMNRKLLAKLLSNRGHVCEHAENGQEAVKMVERELDKGRRFDSILMDYEMPLMNGPTAAQRIRSIGCESFIVGITGNVLPEDIDYFKSCGANRVLGKPVDIQSLETLWIEYGITEESQ